MEVKSILVDIPNNGKPTTEYIEKELTKRNITPLRWAIVNVSDRIYKVSVANLKEQEGKSMTMTQIKYDIKDINLAEQGLNNIQITSRLTQTHN